MDVTANIASSNPAANVIVFTDLDGTLLDHTSYDYAPAQPTLDRLLRQDIPLVLASSKTASEMVHLRRDLRFDHCPAICENGAGVVPARAAPDGNSQEYVKLREKLDNVPGDLRACFEGFGDMSLARISEATGLSPDNAHLAAQRAFSEPGIWTGSDDAQDQFLSHLRAKGITARRGGRFLTLSFGGTKADQMERICAELDRTTTIALGDAPNDVEMLNAADYAIVLPNAHGHPVRVTKDDVSKVVHADQPGPTGWHASLGAVLTNLGVAD